MKRVFLGIIEVAGYYTHLQRGLEAIGVETLFLDVSGHPFQYGNQSPKNAFMRWLNCISVQRAKSKSSLEKMFWITLQRLFLLPFFFWALTHFDVFVFGFRSSLLPNFVDLPILKLFRKRIITVFHGSDSRPPYLDGSVMAKDRGRSITECILRSRLCRYQLEQIERYADVIVCHPPSAHFHRQPFIPWLRVGIPIPIKPLMMPAKTERSETVCILHSPSHPEAKGTHRIREAIQHLQAKGHRIEFIEISGKPNVVVLDELAKCDLVIDQLYSDTPMAGFATEAAAFGKPALVGGYSSAEDWGVSPDCIPPTEFVHPDDFELALERLVSDPDYREALGARAQAFVEERWSTSRVAERFLQLIEKDIPDDWFYDPERITNLHGACLNEARIHELVTDVIEQGGVAALQLQDKPQLEQRLVAMTFEDVLASDDQSSSPSPAPFFPK
jgi:hypothetical protein